MTDNLEEIPSFEYVAPPAVEFRLYYDENGKVITYTGEKLEGTYIIVDAQTFAEARQDVRVVDGQIKYVSNTIVIPKLKPSDSGTPTSKQDISIVVDEQSTDKTYWGLTLHELG